MKKYLLIAVALLLCVSVPSLAQKKNYDGLKMVSHIKVRWYSSEGYEETELARDLYYHYNDKTELIGIDDVEHGESGDWTIKYRMTERGLVTGKLYHNGRLQPNDSTTLQLGWRTIRERDQPVYDDENSDVVAFDEKNVYMVVRQSDMGFVLTRIYIKRDRVKDKESAMEMIANDIDDLADRKYRSYDKDEKFHPFSGELCYYFSEKGEAYVEDDVFTSLNMFTFIDGDMHRKIGHRNNGDIREMNEYSDRINDTNMEFYGLATSHTINNWFSMPEYTSEWCNMRSKHLLNYVEKYYNYGKNYQERLKKSNPELYEQKMAETKLTCKSEWHYTFDTRDNLVGIEVIDYHWFNSRCIMEVEYVQ